jgi:hypothetical protein
VTLTFSVFPRAFFGSVKLHELAIFFPFSVAVQLTRSGRIGVEVAVLLRHVPRVSRRLRGQDGCAAWSSQSADNCNNACRQSRLLLLAHRALRGAPTLNQPGGRVVVPREVARCSWPFGMSTPRDPAAVLEISSSRCRASRSSSITAATASKILARWGFGRSRRRAVPGSCMAEG